MTHTAATAVEITSNERRVLRSIITNWFIDSTNPTGECWSQQINDAAEPSGLSGKTLSGVCGSLAQKGLVKTSGSGRDAVIWLTDAGVAAAR